jgi:hypothetical protein
MGAASSREHTKRCGERRLMREEVRQAHEAQRKDEIAACQKTLEDEMRRHAKAIDATRSATVSSVQGKLPAVFQAMAAYSASLAHALDAVCRPPQITPTLRILWWFLSISLCFLSLFSSQNM